MMTSLASCELLNGEGDASEQTHSLGEVEFEVPEGYKIEQNLFGSVDIGKEDANTLIVFSKITGNGWEEVQSGEMTAEDALKSYYDVFATYWGYEPTEIAGYEGFIIKDPDSDQQIDVTAGFKTEEAVYVISCNNIEFSDEGEVLGENFLTDEEVEDFYNFIAAIRQKQN